MSTGSLDDISNPPRRASFASALALAALCVACIPSTTATAAQCALEAGTKHSVTRVSASGALILDDGREAVLIGALLPTTLDQTNTSIAALKALVEGQSVELAFAGRRFDRYGRLLAHVFVQSNNQQLWVQGHLIENGHARAYALPGNTACLTELLAHEQRARQRTPALWSQAQFQDRDATDARALQRYRDTFQSVVGRVENIIKVRGETVLLFSADGLAGFNATIARSTSGDKINVKSVSDLKHKTVRIRGWIDQRRGPSITLNDVREIELLDDPAELQGQNDASQPPPAPTTPAIPVIAPAP